MGDCGSVIPQLDREEDLIAAAKHIARALESKKYLTEDAKKILADLGTQLSNISVSEENESNFEGIPEIEKQLNAVEEKIMSWETDQSMIWDSGLDEAAQYLNAVDEARTLAERLEMSSGEKGLLQRCHDIIQMGMSRLEEEFKHLLIQNRQPFEPEHVSFRSSEDDTADFSSVMSLGDDSPEASINRDSVSRNSEEFIIDLVHPEVIPDLKTIANLMFVSNYGHECSQAYISVRRDALDECLFILEMEKLSIEDVLKLEWGGLNSKIKRWVRAMKIFVRVYLASEKYLTEQIFGDLGTANPDCFPEASKASMLQLLNFGDAISIGPHKPEKLFPILDMYEVLADLLLDIDSLYSEDSGSSVRTESHAVLKRLGAAVKAAFHEFESAIATNVSQNPFPGGGVHHLTRYVMNYINTLTDYRETLDFLLKEEEEENPELSSPDAGPPADEDNRDDLSPMARHFRSVAAILECNLEDKSRLYKDQSMQHIFLMNNIHYMTQKIKNSELRTIFGDDWIRKHNGKFQQQAMNYERTTWSSVLALLKDEGNSNSDSVSKTLLKEQFRNFNMAFEEVYRTQTAWIVPDPQLREDLQISMSVKVIQAYRTFVGRHSNHISDKHIKHTPDDLENFLCDLLQGSQKSLHSPHRR